MMVGSSLATALALGLGWLGIAAPTQDAPKSDEASEAVQFGDVPEPFVPLHPRTAEQRERIEAVQLFVEARALEDQRKIPEAIDLLEQALKKDPQSVAILDRLSRLNRALGRLDESIAYSQKALELDPGDSTSLLLLVAYHLETKKDAAAAEKIVQDVLANPKLDPDSPGAVLAYRLLGDIQAEFLGKVEEAADAFAEVMDKLDALKPSELSPAQYRRILRGDEAQSYLRFGEVFLLAKKYDRAVKALRRGLIYDPESAAIPRFLAEALLKAGRADEALATIEAFLKRQPQGREPYELLGQILDALGRDDEFLGRLEAAAKADSKNISLQFALAERLREAGRDADADALLRDLLAQQGDPQVFGPLSASLLKEKKTEELVKVIRDALDKRGGPEAIGPQVEAIARDPEYAAEVLDAAVKLFEAEPEKFGRQPREIFAYIANKAKHPDQLIALDRLAAQHDPSYQNSLELTIDLFRNGKYREAAESARAMIEAYPDEKTAQHYDLLARSQYFAGEIEDALASAREAQKLAPDEQSTLFLIGYLLSRLGRNDEAIAHYNQILERFPNDEDVERQARAGLSSVYVNLKDFEKGEAELEKLLVKYPDDPGVNNDLGYLYADQGKKLEQAEQMIRKALEAEAENSAYLDSLGWVLFKQGKLDEALVPLLQAAEERTADATVLDHLGDVYYRLKKYRKAQASWKRAAEVGARSEPPDERLPSIRKKLEELDQLLSASPTPPEDGPTDQP